MYPACLMYPMQSSSVIVENANLMKSSGECVEMYALSFLCSTSLTFANTSSSGMRSELYGGKYMSRALTPLMIPWIRATWWILTLSIITIDQGFRPSKGIRIGRTHLQKKCWNTLPFTLTICYIHILNAIHCHYRDCGQLLATNTQLIRTGWHTF